MSIHYGLFGKLGVAGLAFASMTACSRAPEPAPADAPQAHAETAPSQSTSGAEPERSRLVAPPLAPGREGALPPDHPPIGSSGEAAVATEGSEMSWTTPADWVEQKPASSMRRAQYGVPGPGGDGELVVFYFGPGQGGTPMANAERWAGQFTLADGQPAASSMKTATMHVGSIKVLTVEVTGTYDGGMTMTAAPATPKPGYMLLGAIAEGPDAYWFFKFTGPEATVRAQRAGFEAFLRSLKPS